MYHDFLAIRENFQKCIPTTSLVALYGCEPSVTHIEGTSQMEYFTTAIEENTWT
jgi:hypothetical protein